MTVAARRTIAAVITAVFLAASGAAGLIAQPHQPHQQSGTGAAVIAAPAPTTTWHEEND